MTSTGVFSPSRQTALWHLYQLRKLVTLVNNYFHGYFGGVCPSPMNSCHHVRWKKRDKMWVMPFEFWQTKQDCISLLLAKTPSSSIQMRPALISRYLNILKSQHERTTPPFTLPTHPTPPYRCKHLIDRARDMRTVLLLSCGKNGFFLLCNIHPQKSALRSDLVQKTCVSQPCHVTLVPSSGTHHIILFASRLSWLPVRRWTPSHPHEFPAGTFSQYPQQREWKGPDALTSTLPLTSGGFENSQQNPLNILGPHLALALLPTLR